MRRHFDRKRKPTYRPTLGIVINKRAKNYSSEKIDYLVGEIARARCNWHKIESDSEKEVTYQIRKLLSRRPAGIIACGGDSTVNLVGKNLIRRTCTLGIFPMGRFNNIYQSLYGPADTKTATQHILSGDSRKIDYGLACGKFFIGSIGIGLIPGLLELINEKRVPRFGIGWSRLASLAAASVEARRTAIAIDEFKFDITPLIIHICLLPNSIGLPLSPTSVDNDGKCEVIFDIGGGQAILSGYIRKIFKRKYIYSNDIRIYRGNKITISPVKGRKLYIDGEIKNLSEASLNVETFPSKIRVYKRKED